MEKLKERLGACQDQILTLIEKDSHCLEDHIRYWEQIEAENVLLYAARQQNLKRLGFEPVPSKAVSEAKAKQAIMLRISLQSLLMSDFGQEPWTFTETSAEQFEADPKYCFKKNPRQVRVLFEGDPEKAVPYVLWGQVFVQDNNQWHKLQGGVDYNGLYTSDNVTDRVYYCLFATEAPKFGDKKPWLVCTNDGHILTSSESTVNSPQHSSYGSTSCSSKQIEEISFWGTPGGPSSSSRRPSGEADPGEQPTAFRSQAHLESSPRGRGFRGGQRKRGRSPSPSGHPEKAKRRPGQAEGNPRQRSGSPTISSGSHPVIIFEGPPNVLKCWRWRTTKGYKHLFKDFSSTFSFLLSGPGRGVSGCVLVAFHSEEQMTSFLLTVPRPKNVGTVHGHLNLQATD